LIRPASRFILHATAAIVAAFAVALAAVAWRLTSGPVSLGFLTPYVADALRQSDSPYRVDFADTVLTWAGRGHPLDIRILEVRAVGPDGAVAATVPEISLRFSMPALFRGMIAPTSLEIIEPRMRMVRARDGGIEFGFGDMATVSSEPIDLLFTDLLAPPDHRRAMGYLRRVSVIDADLTVEDQRLGTSWSAPHATVRFRRDEAGINATATLDLEIAGHTAEIDALAHYSSDGGWTTAHLGFTGVQPQWLAQGVGAFARLEGAKFPVSGSLDIALGADGAVSRIGFDVNAGAGRVEADDWLEEALAISYAQANGTYFVGINRVRIDDAIIDFGGPTLTVKGLIEGAAESPVVIADVTVTDLPVDDVARFWPASIGTATRKWIVTNLTDGMVRKARANINLASGDLAGGLLPDKAVDATVELEGVTVNYLDPLPKVVDVDGVATVSGRNVKVVTSGGRLDRLRAGKGLIQFDDIGGADLTNIDVAFSGPIEDAVEVLAHPRLGYAQMLGIAPVNIGGTTESNLHFAFQIRHKLTLKKVAVTASARLLDTSFPDAFGGYNLSQGTLSLTLDRTGMDVLGSVALDNVPANIVWRRNFGTDAPFSDRYTVKGRFTDGQRKTLGFPGSEYVSGPVIVDAEITNLHGGKRDWNVSANLHEAELRVNAIRWRKPAGVDGDLRFAARSAAGKPFVVDSLEIAAGDLTAVGSAEFDSGDWSVRRLDLSHLDYGDTNVRATMVPIDDGGYRIDVDGASFDLRPYLGDRRDGKSNAPLPTLSISAKLDRLIVREGHPVTAVNATGRSRDGRWETASVVGMVAGGEPVSLKLGARDTGRNLTLTSDDAGEVLRSFDVFDNLIGGRLMLTADLDARDGPAVGELRISDFTLINAPTLAKILSVASFTGVYNLLKGEGLPFKNLVIPFKKSPDKLEIEDARSYGAALGLTIEGHVDLAGDVVDLNGTLVPAYTLNSVIGKVPLLGDILVGPKGGGVFAATYRVIGPLDGPTIVVNPLAAFAPGLLRRLFFFSTGTGDVKPYDEEKPGSVR
jgi:hypothetical protein